jgi:hypothetical protein
MKWIIMLCLSSLFIAPACKNREKEKQLEQKRSELNEREQQLLLKERTLQLREEELNDKMKKQDSLPSPDSSINNPDLVGTWSVKMTCIETSCPGSAVGDTKNEEWEISYQGNHVVAKATARDKFIRVYSGKFTGNTLELIEHRESSNLVYDTRMVVRLRMRNNKSIEGQREIIREDECKIVYALQLDKQ